MKKIVFVMVAIAVITGGGIWWWKTVNDKKVSEKNNNETDYQAERSSVKQNNENIKNSNQNTSEINTTNTNTTNNNSTSNNGNTSNQEKEIAKFSTKIYTKESERQNNIGITCKTLSSKKVEPGEIFSFCNTVGKATTAKGYKEADIYVNGKKEKGLGGGNCQVSTTLYNAVLKVPGLEVVERHQHSNHVPYIQDGKDAAVAYGSYDFKFKNNTGKTIKIVMENTTQNVTAKIYS
ncbi:putative vancomycin resistance protein [Clostridium sp. CAG:356]|nr:putative vancomycin resistance protein [Clostridium sp. CAG:356]